MQIRLSKHEGAGNDFLVLVDPDRSVRFDAGLARALCDRHRGVGADGLIRLSSGTQGADCSMELRNADGGEAEMSGNGVRCLAQAGVDVGMVPPSRFTVATAVGVRTVRYVVGGRPGTAAASVDMGPAILGPDQPQPEADRRVREVSMGNPHVVLYGPDDPSTVAVAEIGAGIDARRGGGVNVEFVASGPRPDELLLRTWERGVGETRACGTGSCAVAAAARSWGLVGDRVRVHNPGGFLEVRLGAGPDDPVVLAGPVRRVADVLVELDTYDLDPTT